MGQRLSMATRKEITKKYAREYVSATRKEKGRLLDELVGVTGWSRANARRSIAVAAKRKGSARAVVRKPRSPTGCPTRCTPTVGAHLPARTVADGSQRPVSQIGLMLADFLGKYFI